MAVFSAQTTRHHRAARFALVPFIARLLTHGPLRGDSPPLPRDDPSALTSEAVDAIKQLLNRGAWRFLSETCGWTKVRGSRLWQQPAPALTFSKQSIDLLLAIYNFTRSGGSREIAAAELPDCLGTNGDLLLHHLVFRRLRRSSLESGIGSNYIWTAWAKNPLNCAWQPALASASSDWQRLTADDIAPFLPWISEDWRANSRTASADRWFNPASLEEWCHAHSRVYRNLISTFDAAGRIDLTGFLLNEFQTNARFAEDDLAQFDRLTQGASIGERRRIARPWAEYLEIPTLLQQLYQTAYATHPIDRDQPQTEFMAHFHKVEFDNVLDILGNLRQELRPTLS